MSTALAVPDSTELAAPFDVAAEIAAAQAQEYDADDLISTPILKIGQALTKEVQDGECVAGEFINTLTNEGIGNTVEFIIAYYNKGRAASDKKSGRFFVAFTPDIPEAWAPLVGDEFVGTPFTEYPEAEESFKASVNAKERDWDKGPLVSTTHNFTGYVLIEADGDEVDYQPVRLSLMRTQKPAIQKINTLQRAVLRNKPSWDRVIKLVTVKKEFGKNAAYVIDPTNIKYVRETTADEKALSAELAIAVIGGRTHAAGAEDALEDRAAEPAANGGLAV